ncbi:non-ribosomal peptide synthetase [Microbulbifer halophilus]|uniref:Non-ribosomal peptide synthetase n=1 Tax=Microbulbifer halophilus TaxID=453963 RepID=A0ABW5E721_9GAMM|nr:non-ribosomal peptide synthetase [Microbulbifer halophilus]MCW8127250.1 amino acid adenylation domain-containing protein [Microbulbifer halophilus]
MTVQALLHDCWARGITLSVDGEQLAFRAPPGALDDALRAHLREQKPALLAALREAPDYFDGRPLGANERSLWFLNRMAPDSSAYNLAFAAQLHADISADAVARAFAGLQVHHPILCSPYGERDGEPLQWLDGKSAPRPLERCAGGEPREQLAREADSPLDLAAGQVCRALLLESESGEGHHLLLVVHHIAADFASFEILLRDFIELIDGAGPGEPDTGGYRAWVAEQARAVREQGDGHLDYWCRQLDGVPGLALPLDFPRPAEQTFDGEEIGFALTDADSRRLREAARQLGVTPYVYWLALFQWFLGRLSGQRAFALGTPSGGRLAPEHRELVGYLVNPLVLACRPDESLTLAEWMRAVRLQVNEALEHQRYPFAALVEKLQPEREAGRAPLFQHMFTLNREQPLPAGERVIARRLLEEQRGAAHELNLVVVDRDDGFQGKWRYNRALYTRATVARFRDLFLELVRRSPEWLERRLEKLEWPPQELAARLAGEPRNWPDASARGAFARQVRERPRAAAIRCNGQSLSYGELAQRVNGCAAVLAQAGLGAGDCIALCLPRGVELVTAMLASWQRDAAYVALDPQWPPSRLAGICEDAGPRLVAGLGERPGWLPPDTAWLDAGSGWPARPGDPPGEADPQAPAYIIYTSGSSGRPKGVAVGQGALQHYARAVTERLDLPEGAGLASLASTATDLGYTALFGALLTGRSLRLLDESLAFDAEELAAQLEREPVDCLKLVPSHLKALLVASRPARLLPRLCLVCGGEALSPALVEQVRALSPGLRILNHYGPTETTVGAIACEVADPAPAEIPIGRPLANVTASVRNAAGQLLPRGVAGELCLGGATLALGYLDNPQLTAAAFVERDGERVYRTGDRAKMDGEGQLHFLGRIDRQVKIRGYRVEPDEVAGCLRARAPVRDAAVVNRPDDRGRNRLVAYLVSAEGELDAVREALAEALPDYMLPAAWIALPALPLKNNGKLDEGALPEPEAPAETARGGEADGDSDGDAAALLAITRELLGNDRIGADDNFFAVGGDSILSLQIIARAKQQGLQLTPKMIFEHQTVAALARVAGRSGGPTAEAGPATPDAGFPLTPIQHWFFALEQPAPGHWNQSLLLDLQRAPHAECLRRAVDALLQRHPVLRTRFDSEGGRWRQCYQSWGADMVSRAFAIDDGAPDAERLESHQRGFALERPPLIRLVWFPAAGRLLCTAHHLIVDAVSWRQLLAELEQLYLAHEAGGEAELPPPGAGYHQWSQALAQRAAQPDLDGQLAYWRQQLQDQPPLPAAPNRYADSRTHTLDLDADTTAQLLGGCHEAYNTNAQDLMLAALARAIGRWQGLERVAVELENHGRAPGDWAPDVGRSPGWFTSRYPLALPVRESDEEAVIAVKESLRSVPESGVGYGLLRFLRGAELPPPAGLVTFNYLGQFDQWGGESRLFRIGEWSCPGARAGENLRSHWLDVNTLVLDGRLQAEWRYVPAVHGDGEVHGLARAFFDELAALVRHCAEPAAGRVTASDFPEAGLSDDELQGLLESLDS